MEYGISGEVSRSVHGHPTGRKEKKVLLYVFLLFKSKSLFQSWAKVIKDKEKDLEPKESADDLND